MAVSGVWVDCEIIENKDDDLCLYLVDRSIIMRDDLPDAKNGEILIIVDTIIPTLRKYLEKCLLTKKGILIYNKELKEKQER